MRTEDYVEIEQMELREVALVEDERRSFTEIEIEELQVEINSIEIAIENAYFRDEAADLRRQLARKSGELKAKMKSIQ